MTLNLKTKIWLTVCSIVLMFSFFTFIYFPRQQGELLINNYNTEIQNLANTVALGVKIAITEQNFEGVQTAIEFVKDDPRLQFVSMLQYDTVWNGNRRDFKVEKTIFKTFPEAEHPNPEMVSNDSMIVKNSPFVTEMMSGAIMMGFNTKEIVKSQARIRNASMLVSGVVFLVGILIGFWLAKNISVPVLELRDAAQRVGEGDLNQKIKFKHNDEIGQLGKAFNKMIDDLTKTRMELNKKNATLSNTVEKLNDTMVELKNTHAQLIQSEKMASLGELTAGIAHEIQNPLNFVNNFSDVNSELIEELEDEIALENYAAVKTIASDIKENEGKIVHHGRRAAAIVKGMLQHSRSSQGVKEEVKINLLAKEYLRLAYHGIRAKDKSFSVSMKTSLDDTIGFVKVVPQDIGRVLLNLITNSFYALAEKKAKADLADTTYEPLVSLTTKKENDKILISIKDNGTGIPQKILGKIFQPFFTTKPTGEGTGLGLSLSYDIIKAHGGEINIETKEGEGSEFVIQLPIV